MGEKDASGRFPSPLPPRLVVESKTPHPVQVAARRGGGGQRGVDESASSLMNRMSISVVSRGKTDSSDGRVNNAGRGPTPGEERQCDHVRRMRRVDVRPAAPGPGTRRQQQQVPVRPVAMGKDRSAYRTS